jgi:hypothetical protein
MTLSKKVKVVIIVAAVIGGLLVFGSAPLYYTLFPAAREEAARRSISSSNQLPDNQTLAQEVTGYMQQQGWNTSDTSMRVAAEGIVKTRYFNNIAGIIIIAEKDQYWNGSIGGSDGVQTSWDGAGGGYKAVVCEGGSGIYSVSMQRTRNFGYDFDAGPFIVQVWEEGKLLKEANTDTQFGVVTVSGECSG